MEINMNEHPQLADKVQIGDIICADSGSLMGNYPSNVQPVGLVLGYALQDYFSDGINNLVNVQTAHVVVQRMIPQIMD